VLFVLAQPPRRQKPSAIRLVDLFKCRLSTLIFQMKWSESNSQSQKQPPVFRFLTGVAVHAPPLPSGERRPRTATRSTESSAKCPVPVRGHVSSQLPCADNGVGSFRAFGQRRPFWGRRSIPLQRTLHAPLLILEKPSGTIRAAVSLFPQPKSRHSGFEVL
jgi:hypothetical protein